MPKGFWIGYGISVVLLALGILMLSWGSIFGAVMFFLAAASQAIFMELVRRAWIRNGRPNRRRAAK